MLLLLLLIVKANIFLERKNTMNPTLVKKTPITNLVPLPTFSPLCLTSLHLENPTFASFPHLQKEAEKGESGNVLPTFLLTTTHRPP